MTVLLTLLGTVYTAWFVHDLVAADSACSSAIPWFEGLTVQSSEVGWPPPVIRCTFVDHDPDQLGDISGQAMWDWGEVGLLVAVDLLASTMLVLLLFAAKPWSKTRTPLFASGAGSGRSG